MDSNSRALSDDAAIASLTAIITAYISRNEISPNELPTLIARVQCVLTRGYDDPSLDSARGGPKQPATLASLEDSIQQDYLVCLEDGRHFRSLKRHLKSQYNMTPDEYRRKWNLPPNYPMVAPAYAQARSAIAKNLGLGVMISKRNGKAKSAEIN